MTGPYQVAIIGAGFCGTMVAANLCQQAPELSIALIERENVHGRGLAYGTEDPDHLLNVRVDNMGAFSNDPRHFSKWLEVSGRIGERLAKQILCRDSCMESTLPTFSKRRVGVIAIFKKSTGKS